MATKNKKWISIFFLFFFGSETLCYIIKENPSKENTDAKKRQLENLLPDFEQHKTGESTPLDDYSSVPKYEARMSSNQMEENSYGGKNHHIDNLKSEEKSSLSMKRKIIDLDKPFEFKTTPKRSQRRYRPPQNSPKPVYRPPQTTQKPIYRPQSTPKPVYRPQSTPKSIYRPPQTTPKPIYRPPQTTPKPIYRPPQTTPKPIYRPQSTPKPVYRPQSTPKPIYRPPQTTSKPVYRPPQTTPKPVYRPPQTTTKPTYRPQTTPKPVSRPPQTTPKPIYRPPQTTPKPYPPNEKSQAKKIKDITDLLQAIKNEDFKKVKHLVEHEKVDIMNANMKGRTPLDVAMEEKRTYIASYLFQRMNVRNIKEAIVKGKLDVVKYYVEYINVRITDTNGNSPLLDFARKTDRKDIVNYFLRQLKAKDIFAAIDKGNLDLVKYYAEDQNVDLTKKYVNYGTPLEYARQRNQKNIAEYLVQKLDVPNIFEAIKKGYLDVVKFYVEDENVDLATKNDNDRTPLDFARELGQKDIAEYIAQKWNHLEEILDRLILM